jgi:hypothetical protein
VELCGWLWRSAGGKGRTEEQECELGSWVLERAGAGFEDVLQVLRVRKVGALQLGEVDGELGFEMGLSVEEEHEALVVLLADSGTDRVS